MGRFVCTLEWHGLNQHEWLTRIAPGDFIPLVIKAHVHARSEVWSLGSAWGVFLTSFLPTRQKEEPKLWNPSGVRLASWGEIKIECMTLEWQSSRSYSRVTCGQHHIIIISSSVVRLNLFDN